MSELLVNITGLGAYFPNGEAVFEGVDFKLAQGEVVALLGPSGAGKSTFLEAVFFPERLRAKGFRVEWESREVQGIPGYVPQRGALLDHLDVAHNIQLAQAAAGTPRDTDAWLDAVDLDASIGAPGRRVDSLSGGQAQRLAVARVLAAGKQLVVMDEPSVGLDPVGVRQLARLLVTQARRHQVSIIVVTHDLMLAGGAADAIRFLDPGQGTLLEFSAWQGPSELDSAEKRQTRQVELENVVEHLLLGERPERSAARGTKGLSFDLWAPLQVAGQALIDISARRLAAESSVVLRRTLLQALLRPWLFYAIVGALLGFTVPYVIANISADLDPAAIFGLLRGTYIVSLAPPLSAIVFVATSGSAIAAWLGGLRFGGQVTAVEGLGVPAHRYFWSPSWWGLVFSYLVTVFTFTLAMLIGGYSLYAGSGVENAWDVITTDFAARPPERRPYLVRAFCTVLLYTLASASIVVSKGGAPKARSEDVTSAMTSSVMRVTLFVVVLELVSVMLMRANQ